MIFPVGDGDDDADDEDEDEDEEMMMMGMYKGDEEEENDDLQKRISVFFRLLPSMYAITQCFANNELKQM